MKRIYRTLLIVTVLAAFLAGILFISCTERTSNVNHSSVASGDKATQTHVFYNELRVQLNNPFQLLSISVYLPYTHTHGLPAGPIPLVILIPPQGGNEDFYLDRGLQQVADELIAKGEIQPMAVACIDNAPVLGGVFAGGTSPAAGLYDELIGDSLLAYLNKFYPGYFRPEASQHGIGGVGMGAYGAMRAAILNPDKFSSVTVIDGPLDFDGATGNDGMFPLFTQALAQQGLWGDTQYLTKFDSGDGIHDWRLSRMLLAAALAFSPHDTTAVAYTRLIDRTPAGPGPEDEAVTDSVCTQKITDNGTYLRGVFTQPYRTCGGGGINFGDMHLPFTVHGNIYTPIWNLWLANNPERLLQANPDALDNTKLWFATSPQSEFRYYQMTQSFISTLTTTYGLTSNVTEFKYNGTPDLPASDGQYTYDLLKQILVFHNKNFHP